jgi:hypothetical protein
MSIVDPDDNLRDQERRMIEETNPVLNKRPAAPLHFIHPLKADEITDENYRAIANGLFLEQTRYASAYTAQISESGYWSDDDTDYLRTCLNATERLMDLAYDHTRDDLVAFLYTPRNFDDSVKELGTLAEIISAGGLCESLSTYEQLIYDTEDRV